MGARIRKDVSYDLKMPLGDLNLRGWKKVRASLSSIFRPYHALIYYTYYTCWTSKSDPKTRDTREKQGMQAFRPTRAFCWHILASQDQFNLGDQYLVKSWQRIEEALRNVYGITTPQPAY